MPIIKIDTTPRDDNYYRLPDLYNIDRWMCSLCGFIIDYQFDDEHVGWPQYDPELGTIEDQWLDEFGEMHVSYVKPEDIIVRCPRCGIDINANPPIKIRISPFQDLKAIINLIQQGEGVDLEFKEMIPHKDKVGQIITSFANRLGGRILVGVDDKGNIKGCPEVSTPEGKDKFRRFIKDSTEKISPKVDIRVDFISDNEKEIAIITIPKGRELYLFDSTPFIRDLESTRRATSEEVTQIVLERKGRTTS